MSRADRDARRGRRAVVAALLALAFLGWGWGGPAAAQVDAPSAPPEAEAEAGTGDGTAAEAEAGAGDAAPAGGDAGTAAPAGADDLPANEEPHFAAGLDEADALVAEWEATAQRAATALERAELSTPALEVLRQSLVGQRAAARAMAERLETAAAPLRAQLETLGPPPEDGSTEQPSIVEERTAISARIDAIQTRLRKAELEIARADGLIERIDGVIRERFSDQMLTLGPTPLNPALWPKAAAEAADYAARVVNEVRFELLDPVNREERETRLPLLGAGILLALVLAIGVRRALVGAIERRVGADASPGRRVAAVALGVAARVALPAVALGAGAGAVQGAHVTGPITEHIFTQAVIGLGWVIAARGIAGAFYAPNAPALRLSALNDAEARTASRQAMALGWVFLAHLLVVVAGEETGLSTGTLAVANLVTVSFGATAMWALAGHLRPRGGDGPQEAGASDHPSDEPGAADGDTGGITERFAAAAALAMKGAAALSVGLAATGYYAASQWSLFPLAASLAVVGAGVVVFVIIRDGVEAYLAESGSASGGDGLRLLPVFVGFLITLGAAPVIALIWGARPADLADAWAVISGGVQIGDTLISPGDFLTFALVFGGVYTATRLLQAVLSGSVLPKTRMDAGGRTAIVSGVGYVGFALAAIAGVSAAGLNLSSLAIVAGALSVGIGFGLQTIVNNFVSGIILLIERPVKVGDWIDVGGQQGTVRRISVRATEIETFDRSALILPNSELISGRVINYTHGSSLGRLIVKVGVAYGTDVREVERILRGIAQGERRVVQYPPPQILFAGFGADSLDFEMRLILRDVNTILATKSDMHFAIEEGFREAGIEIPFAQRVVHLAHPEKLAEAMRAAPPAPAGPAPGDPAPPAPPAAEETPR